MERGFVYGLDGTNQGLSGPFNGGIFFAPTPIPGVRGGGSIISGGGTTVISIGLSAALAGKYGGRLGKTDTTNPFNIGSFTGYSPVGFFGYVLRRPCN